MTRYKAASVDLFFFFAIKASSHCASSKLNPPEPSFSVCDKYFIHFLCVNYFRPKLVSGVVERSRCFSAKTLLVLTKSYPAFPEAILVHVGFNHGCVRIDLVQAFGTMHVSVRIVLIPEILCPHSNIQLKEVVIFKDFSVFCKSCRRATLSK